MTGPRSTASPRTAVRVRGRSRGLALIALLLCAFGLVGPAALRAAHTDGGAAPHGPALVKAVAVPSTQHAASARHDRVDTAPAVLTHAVAGVPGRPGRTTATSSPIGSTATVDSPRTRGPPVDARS